MLVISNHQLVTSVLERQMSEKSNLEIGLALIDSGHYLDASNLLMPYAENGNTVAQAKLGILYHLGLGVERDIAIAIKFLQNAAEHGNGEAAHNLGSLYLSCEPEMPVNKELSKSWFQRAKELNFVVADEDWYK